MPKLRRLHNWFGLLFAYRLDGRGGGACLGWSGVAKHAHNSDQPVWVHLDLRHPHALRWLREDSGLDTLTVDALTSTNAGPRLVRRDNALMLILKGIDDRPGAVPGDMVAARIWTDGRLLISCRYERVVAVEDLNRALSLGTGPNDVGEVIAQLAERLMNHADDVLETLRLTTHRLGHAGKRAHTEHLVAELATLRRRMIRMRFHLVPQRRALAMLAAEPPTWLSEEQRCAVHEVVDRCLHAIEGLDAAGEISEITQDEILQRSSETTERRIFSLTVITAIFLPLTFVTGLLGVNLAGIPDAEDPLAFLLLCAFLAGVVALQLWLLRRKGWL